MKRSKKKGFTLIELVIVLAVLAIIALIAIPNFTRVRNNAVIQADNTSKEQITNIMQTAVAEGVLAPVKGTKYGIKIVATKGSEPTITAEAAKTRVDEVTPPPPTPAGIPYGSKFTADTGLIALKDHLRDIEAPQEAGKAFYVVYIDENGRIETETGK